MGVTVAVSDPYGGYVRGTKWELTGYICIEIFDARADTGKRMVVDPKDPEILKWLKTIFQPLHLDMLLDTEEEEEGGD